MSNNLKLETTIEADEVDVNTQYLLDTQPVDQDLWVDGYYITVDASSGEVTEDWRGTQVAQSAIRLSEIAEEVPEAQTLVDSGWTYANFALKIMTDKPNVTHTPELSDQLESATPYSFGASSDLYVCHPIQEPHQLLVDIAEASKEDGIELPAAYNPSLTPIAVACLNRRDERRLYDTAANRWGDEHAVALMDDVAISHDDVTLSKSERPVRAINEAEWAKIAALRDALASRAIDYLGNSFAEEAARKAGAQRVASLLDAHLRRATSSDA